MPIKMICPTFSQNNYTFFHFNLIAIHIVRSLGSVESHRLCSNTDCTVFLLCDPRKVKSFDLRAGICKVGVMTYLSHGFVGRTRRKDEVLTARHSARAQ